MCKFRKSFIPGNGKGAAIVGRLCDGCAVADCLNTAVIDGSDNILIGNYGKLCDMRNFITLVAAGKPDYFYGLENVVAYDPNLPAGKTDKFTNVTLASKDKMADSSFFSSWLRLRRRSVMVNPGRRDLPDSTTLADARLIPIYLISHK